LLTSRFARAAMAAAGGGALVVGMIVAAAAPASAATPGCGTTITSSVTLTANMNCSSDTTSSALIIGASGVTVDLNGYKILGPGSNASTDGIVDNAGGQGTAYDDVTVEDGTISNFNIAMDVEGTYTTPQSSQSPYCNTFQNGATVENVTTTNKTLATSEGFYGDCLDGAYIHHDTINDAYTGVELDYSQSSKVNYSHLNSPYYGLYDTQGTGNIWANNVLSNVSYDGAYLDATTSATVKVNTVTGPVADGIYDNSSSNSTINHNTLDHLYVGVYDDVTSGGTVNDNKGISDAYGVYAEDTTDATYTGNKFDNGQYGIETDYPTSEVLTGNTTSDNSEDGVYVYTNNDGTNGGEYSATLNDNTANYNRFGLYSQFATAGSGNKATGNKVVNCYQVSC
jgi:hypothetical protein